MKCSFCGKELPQDADFCPECGMIISLDGSEEPVNEVEIPESEPNVFRTMDFEQEETQPAMELEADSKEETAVVVEAIPEYVPEAEQESAIEQIFAPDEYFPNVTADEVYAFADKKEEEPTETADEAPVEDGFAPESAEDVAAEEVFAAVADEEAPVEDGFAPEETDEAPADDGFAPPEYTSDLSYLDEKKEAEENALTQAEALFGEVADVKDDSGDTIVMNLESIKQAQLEREDEVEVRTPSEEDNSLIEALFDGNAYPVNNKKDDIEDITKAHNESIKKQKEKKAKAADKKASNKGYAMVFALVVVLVGIIFAAGYIMDNVVPAAKDPTTTSPASSTLPTTTKPVITKQPATTTKPGDTTTKPGDTTTKPGDTTTKPGDSTTKPGDSTTVSGSTTTTKPGATTTSVPSTTAPTTTRPTTTTTTTTTTTSAASTVKEPSSWNMSTTIYFPASGSITVKSSPSSSGSSIGTHPYGYPLWAFASENGYYYVESAYLGIYGWVSTSGLEQYVTTTAPTTRPTTTYPTTTRPTTTRPTTTRPTTTQPTTAYDDGYVEYGSPYTAEIYPPQNDALNFRSGPGTQYTINGKVPYGYTVIVHGYSSTSDGWVYAEVQDSRYGGSMEGWVYEDYLK